VRSGFSSLPVPAFAETSAAITNSFSLTGVLGEDVVFSVEEEIVFWEETDIIFPYETIFLDRFRKRTGLSLII
jgi:hypothetical protein